SDREGQYRFANVPAGPITLRASSEALDAQSRPVRVLEDIDYTSAGTPFSNVKVDAANAHVAGIRFAIMAATGTITGRVLDAQGGPVIGETVLVPARMPWIIDGKRSAVTKTLTDAQGQFTLDELPLGRYDIAVGVLGDRAFLDAIETDKSD